MPGLTNLRTPLSVVPSWNPNVRPSSKPSKPKRRIADLPPPPSEVMDIKRNKTYIVGKLLGVGGFARVYEFTELDTNTVYAGKVFDKSTLSKERAREKLSSEIQIQRGLHHINIVSLHHAFEYLDNVYLLLELCPGTSVHSLLQKRSFINEYEARFIFKRILNGVAFLHSHNIIHRDLKLHNLFFSSSYDIKIGDFGLAAQLVTEQEHRRTMCGTPNYMAPEIVSRCSEGHSFTVDIWALGVILFTMLYGRPPFETTDLKATYQRITTVDFSFPESPCVSMEAKCLISKILQLNPDLRPSLTEIELDPWLNEWCPSSLSESVFTNPVLPINQSEVVESQTPEVSAHPPVPFVLCWIDRTEKNGLGYVLSDGTVGALFNDSSKAFITPQLKTQQEFAFISRKIGGPDLSYDSIPQIHSIKFCPENLKKQISLLLQFEGALLAHVKSKSPTGVAVFHHSVPSSIETVLYVKKHFASERATCFRLSNRTLQANFADHSKIIVSVPNQVITYLDDNKRVLTYSLRLKLPVNVAKRLRYLKSQLHGLIHKS
ncbi:hypothetical protein RCL1_006366 [Eukaryota sp. TZLM3-RCL]